MGDIVVGMGVTQHLTGQTIGVGTVTPATGILKGIVTAKDATAGTVDVRVVSTVIDGTETLQSYTQNSQFEFKTGTILNFVNTSGVPQAVAGGGSPTIGVADWYNNQNILTSVADGGTDLVTLPWRAVLNKPRTNNFVSSRDGDNDALHVVSIDQNGSVTGEVGSILEKHANLSKAKDATQSGGGSIYYKNYLADNSTYLFAGVSPTNGNDSFHETTPLASGFSSGHTAVTTGAGAW